MNVPQVFPWIGEAEIQAVTSVIKDNWITEGPRAREFSERLNKLMDVPFGVFSPNGTLALVLGLLALDIGIGDEVIVPDTTFIASANAVMMVGAIPVFAEVNPVNFQIDVAKCEALVTPRTKAIMPVHLYGMSAPMGAVMAFAQRHTLRVIEDAAQAIGVTYRGQHAGTFGDIGCFSFFADKAITTGEGGYVVTKDKNVYERLLLLRNQGRFDRGSFIHPAIGYNFRITDLHAAIGLAQMDKIKEIIGRKLQILEWYKAGLASVPEVRLLSLEPDATYVPFRTVILAENAHQLMSYFSEHQIQSRTFFYPLHLQPCFRFLAKECGGQYDLSDTQYSNAIYGYEHGICLPAFPTLTGEQVEYVCDTVKAFYAKSA